jgi:hypothetical protein
MKRHWSECLDQGGMHRVGLNAKAGKKQRVEINAEVKGECRGWENMKIIEKNAKIREECRDWGEIKGRRGRLMLWREGLGYDAAWGEVQSLEKNAEAR